MLVAAALIGIRAFYSHVLVAPYTKDEAMRAVHLLADAQPATVHRDIPADAAAAAPGPAGIAEIRERGVLRACYAEDEFPFSFFNAKGQLVGFSIELVHRFAESLDLPIEFLPVTSEDRRDAAHLLAAGVCDLYASTMAVSAQRMEEFTMTIPIFTGSIGLIVPDHMRNGFPDWNAVRARGAAVRLGVPGDPEVVRFVRSMLPDATLLPIATVGEKRRILETGSPGIDAVLSLSEEGAAWALLYPRFHLVVPKPVIFTPQGFGVAQGNASLAQTIDAWIIAEKARGTVDAVYRYWMTGEAVRTEKLPRWSVIRNVLGWSG